MERIERLKAFLEENPADSFLKHALALEMIKIGEEGEARKIFEGILANDPSYVGSYYHLAKLLEKQKEYVVAGEWYKKGIAAATATGDRHALNELQSAYNELQDELEENA